MKIKYYHIVKHLDICRNIIKTIEKLFSIISNLQTHYIDDDVISRASCI